MVTKEQKKKKVENRQPSIPAGGPKDQFGKTAKDYKKQTYSIGGKELSKEEYKKAKAVLGFEQNIAGAGAIPEIAAKQRELAGRTPPTTQVQLSPAFQAIQGRNTIFSAREQQAQQEQEQERILTEENPTERSLLPQTSTPVNEGLANIPVFGGIIKTASNVLTQDVFNEIKRRKLKDKNLTPEERKMIKQEYSNFIAPEELRNIALTQIERNVFEEGVTASEKFGMLIEGLPILGGLIGKYVGGLIETPRGNIEELRREIKKEKTKLTKYEAWSTQGIINKNVAIQRSEDMELESQRIESRIKLLINYSPTLQYNTDEISTIQTEILSYRELLQAVKLRITIMPDNIEPNDWNVAFALRSFEDEE